MNISTTALTVILAATTAMAATDPAFDQGRDSIPSPKPAPVAAPRAATAADTSSLWVTFDRADLDDARAAGFPLTGPVVADARAAVYEINSIALPALSKFMHERFNRCAGFFASRSKNEAVSDLSLRPVRSAYAYTLDQQAVVTPLAGRVGESGIRSTIESLSAFDNRYYTNDTGESSARWIADRWKTLSAKIPGANVSLYKHEGWGQPSVILTIPGTDLANEIVVLGGHLDSINMQGADRAPGSDDNASGIAVLTEAVRVLGESAYRPRRTIQFMGYAAEEVGLRGSQDIAARYAADGKKVVGVIQYDMTAFNGDGDGIWMLTDHVDPDLTAFLERLTETYAGVKWGTTECGYACSDHASWTRSGFPAAVAFESTLDNMNQALHTERDTLSTVGGNAKHAVPFAKLAVAFAIELAKTAPASLASR